MLCQSKSSLFESERARCVLSTKSSSLSTPNTNEMLESGLTRQETTATSHSISTFSKMTSSSCKARQHATYSDLYTPESVSSQLNIPSAASLESVSWHRSIEPNIMTPLQEEYDYIYDSTNRRTYYKGNYLGKGGFARVHELEDLETGKVYAGKIIPKSRIIKPRHKEKINREIDLHKNLVHDNIVRFYHCFEDENNVYIILENCSKRSLSHLMKQRKTLPEPEVRTYMRQIVEGLRYLHKQSIVHRDIKLGNMLLTEDWKIKICDFGLASHFEPDAKVSVCGTPNYIAPEVLRREAHGFEADIWALGCIMYAMLVGQPPFETSSIEETYERIAENIYELPRSLSRSARSLIRQLLAPDPYDRPTLSEIMNHEFIFTFAADSASMPCSEASVSSSNDSGFRSDFETTNENCPMTNHQCAYQPSTSSVTSSIKLEPPVNVNAGNQQKIRRPSQILKEESQLAVPVPRVPLAGFEIFKQKAESLLANLQEDKPCGARNRIPSPQPKIQVGHRPAEPQSLCDALNVCLQMTALGNVGGMNPYPVPFQPIFVCKWIDYSNKHGFGFQLTDGYVGILFNDCCRIGYSERRKSVEFQDETGVTKTYSSDALPAHLSERLTLLSYFVRYMDENMMDGSGSQATSSLLASPLSTAHQETSQLSSAHMKRWVRTPEAIIMQLNDNTLQINFFSDHTKIVLSSSVDPSGVTQYWVTYIDSQRSSSTFRMTDIAKCGCDSTLRDRLCYALTVLREFEDLDAETN